MKYWHSLSINLVNDAGEGNSGSKYSVTLQNLNKENINRNLVSEAGEGNTGSILTV